MEAFKLSRKNMADLLSSLNCVTEQSPLRVLQDAWTTSYEGKLTNEMPTIFEKFIKSENEDMCFSINEIVSLGNQIEFTNLSPSAVQNWVKRDVKELIGPPQIGRKYTVDQAAILFIVEDLKAALDFESIRKVLTLIFNKPEDRTDDMVNPVDLYSAYASVFDKIHHHTSPSFNGTASVNGSVYTFIQEECKTSMLGFTRVGKENQEIVLKVLIASALSVQAGYYQSLVSDYAGAALLNGL
ncbi:MAG: DUF1836 domain-containing protein [Bacillota bacterium]